MISNDIIVVLEENKYKITKFRKCFVDLFCNYDHKLLCAKEIKELLEEIYEYNASFDTIYKNLKILLSLSIIHEKIINHEAYYVISKTLNEHHHFICLECNRVYDIPDHCTSNVVEHLYPEFEVTSHSFEVYGLCKDCKKI